MVVLTALRVDGLATGGAGVARAEDGRVVFVRGGCPGDVVDVLVTADKGRHLEGEVAAIVEPSADRRTAPCPYFGVCGGCQWQHISYQAQIDAKRLQVVDALTRIGHFKDPVVNATVKSESPLGYRNKIELRVVTGADGRPLIGMTQAASDNLVPIEACLLLPSRARKIPKSISGALRYLSGRAPFEIGRVAIRIGVHTRDVEIDMWGPPGPFPRNAVAKTLADAAKTTSITRVMVKDGDSRDRSDAKVEVLSGRGHWRERLAGFTYRVSAPSFFQTNTAVAEQLVTMVVDTLRPDGGDRVLDLYAGVGTFTLPLAERAGEVVAVEGLGHAVRDLNANIEDSGAWADVMPGDAARALADAGKFDMAVVDPPRTGLHKDALAALVRTRARKICYVSCDPATLARDARALADEGFELISATPVDMFPQTWHVETVALLERPATKR
ncbi:MAG: 23S rRNA (uracil(1939)-C(5))-methyltransferase RlmD [Coriobacteriia bacterium]|nr:23S rRNA (uracil(1939)-C(5))-methyltransferase RlmD [Coriobacteriia bacterium]